MKKYITLFGLVIVPIAFIGCNKSDTDPQSSDNYSYWMANDDTIAYKDILVMTAPLLTELRIYGPSGAGLSFAFQMGSLPRSGTYKVDYVASDRSTMCNVYVTYNGITYDVSPAHNTTSVLVNSLPNGKGRYELEPTWFYKQLEPSDSILVKGVIIEP